MAKTSFERANHPQRVPDAPDPSAVSPRDGMEGTRAMARRYLPDAMRLFAGIAFAPDSEAALHTKYLAEIVAIAGAIPQATLAPPPYQEAGDGSDPD